MYFWLFSISAEVTSFSFRSSIFEFKEPYVSVSDASETGDLWACNSAKSDSDISSKLSVSEGYKIAELFAARDSGGHAYATTDKNDHINVFVSLIIYKLMRSV